MLTTLIFIIVLGILVLVHELGHFILAKRAGMKVEEFGFGFPPRLFGIKRGETFYSLNLIPFGGFVKILGEDGQEQNNPRSFASAKVRTRAGVIVAGVVMNILLAVVLLAIGNAVGLRVGLIDDVSVRQAKDIKVQIIQVAPNSPAEQAGLKPLDEIAGFSVGQQLLGTSSVTEVQDFINKNLGKEVILLTKNGRDLIENKITPRANPPEGEGALGISLATTGIVRYSWYEAIGRGAMDTVNIFRYTVLGYATIIKNIFYTGSAGVELSGPVGIAVITGKAARLGFTYLMQFTALISVNLAVLNIIPFPALDGGRLLFIGIEKLKGRPVSRKVEATINAVGFALLIMLMIYVTTKDILKFF
ncbi:MAG: RIP metalloprotease RseP [Candidatus Yanofskybacteria bacterium RIFCSPHIGHO2_01_FULL_44_17]|uniref:Zinc metalloprotease n=1 Tax=Candidatus Yanofskybacteria bacterium RIFCSPHIGHO2_01_FULL_44_17 TaxID=1802668 RepID=A0A1F8EYZ0_9BACT|nr:MAG: RIP metalloprotease RseP [Candidatus Yanofskybacteria bacterium RIFCSPHIGHO2_01_FULL_44_17]